MPQVIQRDEYKLGWLCSLAQGIQPAPDPSALDADGLRIPARNGSMPSYMPELSLPSPPRFLCGGSFVLCPEAFLRWLARLAWARAILHVPSPCPSRNKSRGNINQVWIFQPGESGGAAWRQRRASAWCLPDHQTQEDGLPSSPRHFRPVLGNKMQSVSGRPSVFSSRRSEDT